ncbi:MAG TPA: nucleotide exchange factor GrpE [Planctomycetota bacterium]|jgi:molecular chaperone GrpE|nr:nucleotide exchange factor GrpE [Planctomycetota bacterium]
MKRKDHEPHSAEPATLSPEPILDEGWITPEPIGEALGREEELRELSDRLARLAAEFQNSRRRLEREGEAKVERGVDAFLIRVLSVVDHLDLALGSAGEGGKAFVEGVTLIRAELREILASEGVAEIETRGAPFDPKFHEAVAVEERADLPPGSVCDEIRRGYTRRGRVLRPAQVRVSRAASDPSPVPPKESPPRAS